MKSRSKANYLGHVSLLLALMMAFASLAWGQHKSSTPAPPPPKPAAPSRPAAAPSHAASPSHTAPHPTSAAHPTTTGHTNTVGHSTTTSKPGVARPGTTSSKSGTTAKPGTAGHATGTAKPGMVAKTGTPGKSGMTKPGMAGKAGMPSKVSARTPPGRTVSLKGGGRASIRPNGKIRSIDRNGMHIEHGLHGGRTVVSEHNGARVVTTGKHGGYVQRPYAVRNGHTYVSRTYVVNGRSYTQVYRSYNYEGHAYYGYYPAYYYNPGFYGWAYNPWPQPIAWGWGWGGSPWYGYYGGYFAPYPVYPTAAFWLTDYLLSASLQAAYAARAEASASQGEAGGGDAAPAQESGGDQPPAAATSNAVVLTPEVKQAIADEVKAQLASEQAAAGKAPAAGAQAAAAASSGEVPAALDPAHTTFVVSSDLAVTADGEECGLTAGDVLTRIDNTPDSDQKVTVLVTSSKKSDCGPGKKVGVSVDDLQEMHNHFQEQVDQGLKALAEKQGTGGLPKAPDTKTVGGEVPTPPPDTTAANALQSQQAEADQTEAAVVKEAFGQGS